MPSTKKTKKTAKPATTRAVSKAAVSKVKAKTTMPKATAARSKAKSARPAAKSKAGSATAARAGAKTTRASTASKAPASKAAAAKASAKSRSVARATAKGASKSAQAVSKSAQVKAAQAKAAKAQKAKAAAKSAFAKTSAPRRKVEATSAAVAREAGVKKIDHTAKKSVQGRVKEASAEKFKAFHNKKASSDTQNQTKPNAKPVPHASAQPAAVSSRPVTSKPVASKVETQPVRPPVVAGTAPDPRPASPAPVVQPRDTSEQNPVTQKKSASQTNAKPPLKAISTPEQARPETAAVAPPPAPKPAKPTGAKLGFKTHEHIVYPAHGVGQIVAIEEQEVAGFRLELFVISFVKDKMILKVPTPKVVSVGMRKLAEPHVITRSLDTLTGRARIKRTMWSRRAQEYEAKINSGDLIAIAEVVRDLYRSDAQPEQSYSERQLYEAALDRMSRELAVVQKLTEIESLKLIEAQLQKGPRRGAKAEAEAETGDVDEAA